MPRHAANTCPFQLSFLLGLLSLVYLYFFSRCGLLRLCLAPRHSLLSPSCDCFCLSYRQTKRRRCFASSGLARRLPYIPLTRAYAHVLQQTFSPPGGRMSPPTASASSRATSPATKWGTKWTLRDTKARRAGRSPKTACLIKPPAFQWCYSLWIERQARREKCGTRCNDCVPSRRRHFVSHFVGSGAESASEVRRNMTATTCPEIVGFTLAGLSPMVCTNGVGKEEFGGSLPPIPLTPVLPLPKQNPGHAICLYGTCRSP